MSARRNTLKITLSTNGKWYWCLKDCNGNIQARGARGFYSIALAEKSVRKVLGAIQGVVNVWDERRAGRGQNQ